MAIISQSRRKFIGTLVSFLGGFFLLGKYLTPKVKPATTLVTVPKGDLPPRGALVYREARVALIHDGDEVYALDLVCTHLGCTVNVTATELVCPCHGSSFDRRGAVVKGPADRPLARYRVEARGDEYHVLV